MRPQPLIAVTDVEASSRWYQRLLGCHSAHGGTEYERLVSNGVLILQLHRFDVEHHHGAIGDPGEIWVRDPDGYTVVLASPDGSADGSWRPELPSHSVAP